MSAQTANAVGTIRLLRRYPIKSMQGEDLDAVFISQRGLLGDRALALLDAATGMVVSAKNPRRWPTMFQFQAEFTAPPRASDALPPVRITCPDGTNLLTGSGADEQLSRQLGRAVRLAETPPPDANIENLPAEIEENAPPREAQPIALPPGSFFDLAAVHLVTTATLDRLQSLEGASRFDIRRFRPNVVIQTGGADLGFVENDWVGKTVCLGDQVRLTVIMPCPRCIMTTLPQAGLPKDPNVLRAAVKHNQGNVGVYAIVAQAGDVRAGDAVRIE